MESRNDAKAYAAWLSRTTGQTYRLPSEAEWEYDARAGTETPFHFGATIGTDLANYDGNSTYGNGRNGIYRQKTVAVGSFPSNAFGLYDTIGNVWEWVDDCYRDGYGGAPGDGRVWLVGNECSRRVLRGGSWFNDPWIARGASRHRFDREVRSNFYGFRVARTLSP